MQAQSYNNTPGYVVIVFGLGLSLVSALVPHFDTGYRLSISVFAAGLLPYLVYGIAVPLQRGSITILAGLVLLALHAWLVFDERIKGAAEYSDGTIYYVPALIALALLPLAATAFIRHRRKQVPKD